MKKITIVQARVGSSRLPGKVMKTILGKSVLELQLERMRWSKECGQIIVATSINPFDDVIETFCREKNIEVFRGSELDLLERHYLCARKYGADVVAKIPSDCPLIDYRIIDRVFSFYDETKYDYISNLHPATYPDGNDVEIFSMEALERAYIEASRPLEREHTTPYFWENSQLFRLGNLEWERGLDYSMSHRFTIDYQEDFDFIKAVYERLYPSNPTFSLEDILRLLEEDSSIYELNSKFVGVNWYRNHLDELKTIESHQTNTIEKK
jgi:spore coat polysaccharide biosynthesis protein SpsF